MDGGEDPMGLEVGRWREVGRGGGVAHAGQPAIVSVTFRIALKTTGGTRKRSSDS